MLQHIVLAAVLVATALPAPSPSPTPMLKTIANVRSSTRCATIITHANAAITGALSNDQIIGQTITQLRFVNLDDGNPIHRRNQLQALGKLAQSLMQGSRSSDDEVKRLRKLAKESKDPKEGKALTQFANELGGALWSQQKVARDLNGFLAYQDFREMAKFDAGQQAMNQANYGVSDPLAQEPALENGRAPQQAPLTPLQQEEHQMPPLLGHDPNEATATQQAKWAADDFQNRIPVIMRDENLAAGKVDGAISGC